MMRILSLGAGVQSSTVALMSARNEIPMFDAAIFADTKNEPAGVYKWFAWLREQLPYPVYVVSAGDLARDSLRLRTSKRSGQRYSRVLIPVFLKLSSSVRARTVASSDAAWRSVSARPSTKYARS